MTTKEIKAKAIKNYKEIKSGKIIGVKLSPLKSIKVGSITFII